MKRMTAKDADMLGAKMMSQVVLRMRTGDIPVDITDDRFTTALMAVVAETICDTVNQVMEEVQVQVGKVQVKTDDPDDFVFSMRDV